MEVITSHTNADFDTLASMLAAKKLYPKAHLVFSGSLERGLRTALKTLSFPYDIERPRDIDLDSVTRLILVDIRQSSRIGPFARIIDRPGLDLHIYDHHPGTDEDLKGSFEVTGPYGSTTTILTLIIRDRRIELTPHEATILMAGIYEDTGSLGYPSTTTKDYEAASFLLEKGADLSEVSDLLTKELTPEEISTLDEFLKSETTYTIGGADIVIAEGNTEKYKGDIALLAHKIRDIERTNSLFILADMGDRVHMVARSRETGVDAGEVARELGGGGHRSAASATLKGVTLIQAKERLLSTLKSLILPARTAEEVMSAPPITVPQESILMDAYNVIRRFNVNCMPVTGERATVGLITRQVLDKAIHHGLGSTQVKDYMTTDFESVTAEAPIEEIRERVIGHGQRLLPVIKKNKVVGVITRTDLLKLLQEELVTKPKGGASKKTRHLKGLMNEKLPGWVMDILTSAGRSADRLEYKAYVVGGFVRDLILRRENLDIDLVIEGDGIRFAQEFAKEQGLRVRTHERFGTAVLIFPDGFKCDVATARLEYYEKPGALPTVELSSLKLDLYRRDFSINTLAIALNPRRFGELIDFFGGQRDLKEKTIRVLHNLSFVEDPTRALRAVRFSEKFGFKIGTHTLNLIKNAVKLNIFKELSGARILYEIRSILEEETSTAQIRRIHELGLLSLIHEGITWDAEREVYFEKTREVCIWYRLLYTKERLEQWLVLFLALTDPLDDRELSALAKRLSITGKKRMEVLNSRDEGLLVLNRLAAGRIKKNSELFGILCAIPLETLIYLMAKTPKEEIQKMISTYITKLKSVKVSLKGSNLKRIGVPEGPVMGEILRILLTKRLDGELTSKQDEEEFVKSCIEDAKKLKA